MKVLVFGSGGFVGQHVVEVMSNDHEVIGTTFGENSLTDVDLTDTESVRRILLVQMPEVIVNCAGIVSNDEAARMNPVFSENILAAVEACALPIRRVVIMGSAAEYGVVGPEEVPVAESVECRAESFYGRSKIEETKIARKYRAKGFPVIVARLFNPIGVGMAERMLIPRLLAQIAELQKGARDKLEVNRLDAKRDYISVWDLGLAIKLLVERENNFDIVNIGSGTATTNGELIDMLVSASNLPQETPVLETSTIPEPLFAPQANISRLSSLGWKPIHSIENIIKEIVDAGK